MGMDMLQIDGAAGEGGGQIVRSSLALSLLTGRPVTLSNIRAGRAKPGLMRQHLTAVQAAAEVGDAAVRGAEIGSRELVFTPRTVRGGDFVFKVGTAGSATLVLQTVLPALLSVDSPSRLVLEGGTHNPLAPPVDYLERVYAPLVSRMGPRISVQLRRHGFYPAGGGKVEVEVTPANKLTGLRLLTRGELIRRIVVARVANLPDHIARRESQSVVDSLGWARHEALVERVTAQGPGNVLFAELVYGETAELFTGFGRVGVRAEQVGEEVAAQVRAYLDTDAPVGEYLADQLLLPLAIAAWRGAASEFRATPLSLHSTTQISVMQQFLDVPIRCQEETPGGVVHVAVGM